MKKIASTLILSVLLAPCAWAADTNVHSETKIDSDKDGSYKGTTKYEATDSTGAAIKSQIEEKESATLLGKQKTQAKVETSRDPQGLGNKTWAKGETAATVDSKGNVTRETTGHSVDALGTTRKSEEIVKSHLDAHGKVNTEISKEMVTDPKGLMNKSTTRVEETTKHLADGTTKKIVRREVDGKMIEETVR